MKNSQRTSFYIAKTLIKAMEVIRERERVLKSHQVDLGLKLYFEKHKSLLLANGVDLWK